MEKTTSTSDGIVKANASGKIDDNWLNTTIARIDSPTFTGIVTSPTFSGALSGNASTATKLFTARAITLSGDVTGTINFDGSSDVSITSTVVDNSHSHTSVNISDATNANTANMIVKRDASGNFIAGTITANITGDVSGNSGTATKLFTARAITLSGDVTGTVNFDGSSDASITTTMRTATSSLIGGIKVGNNLTITNGVLSADAQAYTLPTASASVLGGVKIGTNLSISDGVLSADDQSYTLPVASTTTLGGVKIGTNLIITDSVLSVDGKTTSTIDGIVKAQSSGKINDNWLNTTIARIDSPTFTGTVTSPTFSGALTGNASSATISTTSTTTEDTTNELILVGVTSGATTTLKRDTNVTVTNDSIKANNFKMGTSAYMTYNSTECIFNLFLIKS